jgi:hypothetical protein
MFDPCKKCRMGKSETFRKVCQGTPYSPGICEYAKEHWSYVGNMSVSHAINDSFACKLRRRAMSGRNDYR